MKKGAVHGYSLDALRNRLHPSWIAVCAFCRRHTWREGEGEDGVPEPPELPPMCGEKQAWQATGTQSRGGFCPSVSEGRCAAWVRRRSVLACQGA